MKQDTHNLLCVGSDASAVTMHTITPTVLKVGATVLGYSVELVLVCAKAERKSKYTRKTSMSGRMFADIYEKTSR